MLFSEWTALTLFHCFLVFTRIGSAMMVMPAFGEVYVTARARLTFSLVLSVVVLPVLHPLLPLTLPEGIIGIMLALSAEALIGLFIGGMLRMVQAVLHMAGMIIAFQSSLASALLFDANQGSQGSVIGNFMTLVGITLLFATGLHHIMIMGIVESYTVFSPAHYPIMGDMAEMASTNLSEGFVIATKISAPMIIIGLLLYLGAGILGRLMPNMQVFFVLVPIQLYVSFSIILMTLSAGMMLYLDYFEEIIRNFLG